VNANLDLPVVLLELTTSPTWQQQQHLQHRAQEQGRSNSGVGGGGGGGGGGGNDGGGATPTPLPPPEWVVEGTSDFAYRCVGCGTTTANGGGSYMVLASVQDPSAALTASAVVNKTANSDIASIKAAHTQWWIDYWSQSFVTLPVTRVEGFYYAEMYRFAASDRVTLHGLMGAFGPTVWCPFVQNQYRIVHFSHDCWVEVNTRGNQQHVSLRGPLTYRLTRQIVALCRNHNSSHHGFRHTIPSTKYSAGKL
jgi:hypothetical protein